jgi:ketosteroid isomerase-like protein
MPNANVETMRQVIEAFQARDWARMRDLLDESFEYHTSPSFPEGSRIYHGPGAMERVREFLDETWAEAEIELREATPVGDAVFAELCGRVRPERGATTLPASTFFQVWRFADQRPASAQSFDDRAEALKAVGLDDLAEARPPEGLLG